MLSNGKMPNGTDTRDSGRGRTRNWTFIVYPESAPENWRDIINAQRVPWVESPLHEGEMNPDNESEKKAHWHIMLMYDSVKTFAQAREISDSVNAPIPQKIASVRGLVRYMAHLDNPEKKQYVLSDIIGRNGADVSELLKPSASERFQIIREMQIWVRETGCMEICDLMDYAERERFDDWYSALCSNSLFVMTTYIQSRRNSVNKI